MIFVIVVVLLIEFLITLLLLFNAIINGIDDQGIE
jgi:hypothetical protein